jgi:hypothetical protein
MTPEEQEIVVQELETALDRLQALYNQYFMGIERLEPTVQHKEVVRKMQALRREKIQNTALRFRFQTQVQKYSTQSNYWKRISRQIEEGTYQRDVVRAQKRTERLGEAAVAEKALRVFGGVDAIPATAAQPIDVGLELDDPFSDAAPKRAVHAATEELDDPFSEPEPARSRPAAAPAHDDPDKTPVPAVGSGVHPLNEQILRSARPDVGDDEDEGDLSSFFQKRPSIAPPAQSKPAPPRAAPIAPPAPRQGSTTPVSPAPLPKPQPQARRVAEPAKAATPTKPAVPAKPEAPAKPATGPQLSEERMKAIYRAYVTARKKTNEPTDSLTYAKIAMLLKKQAAEKTDVTDFKVVIRNGKAIIKTVKEP